MTSDTDIGSMPIRSELFSLVHLLAKKPLDVTSRFSPDQLDSQKTQDSLTAEADQVKPISRNAFSGSGLSLELILSSGQSLDLDIRINQAGGAAS